MTAVSASLASGELEEAIALAERIDLDESDVQRQLDRGISHFRQGSLGLGQVLDGLHLLVVDGQEQIANWYMRESDPAKRSAYDQFGHAGGGVPASPAPSAGSIPRSIPSRPAISIAENAR